MCNFIIRPIKSYATVDVYIATTENSETLLKLGEFVTPKSVDGSGVVMAKVSGENFEKDKDDLAFIPMSLFTHVFSNNDPNKKEDKKKEAK